MKTPLVVGNWKMHGTQAEALRLAQKIRHGLKGTKRVEVALAPPFTTLSVVRQALKGSRIQLAGQNAHWELEGAFTGEISPKMLVDAGCRSVLIGHSERRRLFNETDDTVAKKISASLEAGLKPILCIGETLDEREKELTQQVIARQLLIALKGLGKSAIEKIDIAYEPVWAIGTGRNATAEQVNQAHLWIREVIRGQFGEKESETCRILYGGSVRPDNAAALAATPEVNGLLVGGASLKAEDFLRIIRSFLTT